MTHALAPRTTLVALSLALGCDLLGSSEPAPAAAPAAPAAPAADAKKADPKAEAKDGKVADAKAADAKAPDAKAASAEVPAAAPTTPTPAEAPAAGAGPTTLTDAALFIMRDKGAIVLADGKFTTVPDTERKYFSQIARDHEGKVYALGSREIVAFDGATLRTVAEADYDVVGSLQALGIDRKGGAWVAGSKGVHHFENGAWTTDDLAQFGSGTVLFGGIAVDAEDRPWLCTADTIWHREADGWKKSVLPKGGMAKKYLQNVVAGPAGSVWVGSMDSIYKIVAPGTITRETMPKSKYGIFGDLAFSDSGHGVIEISTDEIAQFLPADKVARYKSGKDYKIKMVTALAVDDRGRTWVAGDGGVAILGPGTERVAWRSGSIEEVAGSVTHLVVVGRGPELPQAGEVKKGIVKGSIVEGDKGVAALDVELCESPSMIYSKTPCTGAPTHLTGKTDASGVFEFKDVPLGSYGVAVKVGKKWQITMGAGYGSAMKAGDTIDVGKIEIKKK
jgi:hypothetical protein